jgi:hypothetical protein
MGEHASDDVERQDEHAPESGSSERPRETRPGTTAPGATGEERQPIGDDEEDAPAAP